VQNIFEYSGRWEPRDQEQLAFQVGGSVRRVNVRRGDSVTAGELLADLQIDDLENQLASAQLSLQSAIASAASSSDNTVESVTDATIALASDLASFGEEMSEPSGLRAFVAVFPERAPRTELAFEARLWSQLQRLHEHDDPDAGWDPSVSDDADDPMFSFSFGGRAYFIVGLHAHSSRISRSFRWPALVFNPHSQFGRLRGEGRFKRIQQAIREREMAVQGSLNPNLADFGERSEARQYSGRAVEDGWRCPFHRTNVAESEKG
jgi:FPC/CPF motif-containing protein YcgG